jgi:type IV pilus assembly protein PilY1
MKPRIVTIFIALFSLLGFVLLPSSSMSTAYKACFCPSVAGVATKPNVMIVMDYSGSMQFRAHYASASQFWNGYYSNSNVAYGYDGTESCKTDAVYNPAHTYYGLFQSNTYYTYDSTNKQWAAAATQPVTAYSFTAKTQDSGVAITAWATAKAYTVNAVVSDSGKSYICTTAHTSTSTSEPGVGSSWTTYWTLLGTGTECILFTAAGHTFQAGQLVEFQGLTSHTGMNGNAFLVAAVSGNTFRIAYPWNGNPDQVSGSVQRRIPGTVSTGLSGNILNYATATRIDCALQALIGGPGTCDSTNCYVTGQGERSYLRESTNIQGEFYVRPCTSNSTATYPDDYSSGTYTAKTTYVSISGRYTGTINTSDSYTGSGSSKYYYHAWKFTTTGASHIDVTLTGTWSSGTTSYVALFSSTSFSGTATTSASGSLAVLSYDISSAGTYYLVVRSNTKNVTETYTLSASQELTAYTYNTLPTRLCPPGDSTGQSSYAAIGSIPQAQIKIKEALADRNGVIQQTFNQVRYGFMYFNSSTGNIGKILVGCENTSLSTLLSAFTTIYPYNGTPTGEALYAALDYFAQSTSHSSYYTSNSSYISKGGSVDPYYSILSWVAPLTRISWEQCLFSRDTKSASKVMIIHSFGLRLSFWERSTEQRVGRKRRRLCPGKKSRNPEV